MRSRWLVMLAILGICWLIGPSLPIANAKIAGSVLLTAESNTASDANVTGNAGMGGQGLLPIPVVYNGWVQNLPKDWKGQLTKEHQNPIQK